MGDPCRQHARDYFGAGLVLADAPWREEQPDPRELTAQRVDELRADRNQLLAAIATLDTSRHVVDIAANLPTVLTLANGVVHGAGQGRAGHWDLPLAVICRDWIATRAERCDPHRLVDARGEVAAAALPVALKVTDWIERADALALAAEGAACLRHLAGVAAHALTTSCPRATAS
jgi:hypothetical protein